MTDEQLEAYSQTIPDAGKLLYEIHVESASRVSAIVPRSWDAISDGAREAWQRTAVTIHNKWFGGYTQIWEKKE